MTQEILDYLSIRNNLLQEHEELDLDRYPDRRECFADYTKAIAKIIAHEDIVLVCETIGEEIKKTIQKYRFEFIQDKEINNNINYIISRFNEYDKMPESQKKMLLTFWYKQEIIDRKLPKGYHQEMKINYLATFDLYNIEMLASEFEVGVLAGTAGDELCQVGRYASLLSTINLLISRYPNDMNTELKDRLLGAIETISLSLNLSKEDFLYTLKTIKHLQKSIKLDKKKRLIFES